MYAAAGGASIANRRKQKRLQLNKRVAEGTIPARLKPSVPVAQHHFHHQQHHQHLHHHHHPSKFARPHVVPPSSAPQLPPPSSAFHSIDRRRHAEKSHQQVAPVSPIHFPISPPPLSLESPSSVTCGTKSNNFPFPPSSILDLRVSPSSSELQCGGGPGKAAWQGCSKRSPLPLSPMSPHGCRGDGYKTKQCEAHRRWMKRNRIRDASYCYGSSGEDDDEDGSSNGNRHRGEVSAAVNTVLYAGLGTTALGLVISFVGTGEKGFLSPELRLVGPSLLCAGLLCCLFRVLLCLCLCRCGECRWRFCHVASDKKKEKVRKTEARPAAGVLPTASLLPPAQQQQQHHYHHHQQSSSSGAASSSTKAHELLLSPAQLPE